MTARNPPVFAVVGRVNKGKSSIIATLAEDPRVAISPNPGTTRVCTEFPVRVDAELLFELVDTPGFEEADRALAWLRAREDSAASHPRLVAEFVDAHTGDDFVEERRLLTPILAGACILYVVDGARPYRHNYESEMEILRWTGQPRMALINRIGPNDHGADWRAALGQYFSVVRDFDAHRAGFDARLSLLRTFGELDDELRPLVARAVSALEGERERRRAEAARHIGELLVDLCTMTLEARADSADALAETRGALEMQFYTALRAREQTARDAVAKLYNHPGTWDEVELVRPIFGEDLFAKRSRQGLGLTSGQLLLATATSGAATGGVVDAFVGAATFFAGAAIGAGLGLAIGAMQLGRGLARARAVGGLSSALGSGRRLFRIGPHGHRNFPFMALDRAILHFAAVTERTHARQDAPRVEGRGPVADLERARRDALDKRFATIRKHWRDPPREACDGIHAEVAMLLAEIEGVGERTAGGGDAVEASATPV